MALLPNLSELDALMLISQITNKMNSGKSQMANIETDQRFIQLRKMVKANNQTKNIDVSFNNDLLQYTQLSTPAMITVSIILAIILFFL